MDAALKILYILLLKYPTIVESCNFDARLNQAEIAIDWTGISHKIRLSASLPGTHEIFRGADMVYQKTLTKT